VSVSDSNGFALSYEYDVAGNKTKMKSPDGSTVTYTYDPNNRLSAMVSDAGRFEFEYDPVGKRTKLSYPNGAYAAYSYDSAGRLTDLGHKMAGGSIIDSFTYTHDNVGNRLAKTTPERTISYSYDKLYQLLEALSSTPGSSTEKNKGKGSGQENATWNQREFYTYDPVGNRLTSEHNRLYEYNEGNELVIDNENRYEYDGNGNLVSKTGAEGTTNYFHDYENRLIQVNMPDGTVVSFRYDPFGRRIEKSVDGVRTRYFYDSEDILFEYDEAGIIGNKYIHGPGIDEPLALINNKGVYYYHADGLGSIVALTDSSAKVVQEYEYDSFGKLHDQQNRIKQPYTFTGREWDRETGLYYYRARYYEAGVGRFISFDPMGHSDINSSGSSCSKGILGFSQEGPQKLNPFLYAGNNPAKMIDPFGLTYLDTVTQWHMQCTKLPTAEKRCECHCVYASDDQGCIRGCLKCFSSPRPLSTYELCMCTCKVAELENCDCICKLVTQ